MKYLAIIFSLYFTVLAILPCQDREDMIASVMHVTFQKSHSPHDERGQETCPPFCTCSCCSTARLLTSSPILTFDTQAVVRTYQEYLTPAVQKQSVNIWQPPQIA
ncbi:DUF6660 family protein [Mucilaginibacter sp. L3T2-6]|uniref:DUF6660 family protein n=1 Tax=Mucilaginibacter sp. L3T2-6 TaxID=3062491 RepID=UPI0026766C04|nr:DUF6660 family protein [Mucilaginibacter sp. L3T2-6]MDO3641494.1 hypothetical protein [Mucilaginibacter sp. L3T2-6]MDV6213745.1 DUF6660 family protein [Mucilaginibacter sp. L3T2-6]